MHCGREAARLSFCGDSGERSLARPAESSDADRQGDTYPQVVRACRVGAAAG